MNETESDPLDSLYDALKYVDSTSDLYINETESDLFDSLDDALRYVGLASGLYINETLLSPQLPSNWLSVVSILPLILGFIGLIFNILALLIFTISKTFGENSFRFYIYAFVFINCASILNHSWFYLIFYLVDPIYFCKYLQYFQQSTAATALWVMVLLSFERSVTFSQPFVIKKLLQPRTICFTLISVTFFCFLIHIDELFCSDVKAFRWVNFAYGLCSFNRYSRFSSIRIKMVTHFHSFILPFTLNSIFDIYICYKICQRRQRLAIKSALLLKNNLNKNLHHQQSKSSLAHEITLTLLCQSLWLLFTNFPRHLYYFLISYNLINDYDRDNSISSFLFRLNLLIYLAFSPILYIILSSTLRKEILTYLLFRRPRLIDLTNIENAEGNFLYHPVHHHYREQQQQQRDTQPVYLTVLITKTEQMSENILSELISVPTEIEYISKSMPCLLLYKNENEYEQCQKTERCNTSNE